MRFIQSPTYFDVIVTENTFGDIITDEASTLTGSMGMMPSASIAGIPKAGDAHHGLLRADPRQRAETGQDRTRLIPLPPFSACDDVPLFAGPGKRSQTIETAVE